MAWVFQRRYCQNCSIPFFTTKAVGKGTGLGLSISHQVITEKHGGKLICNSAPGVGTEFVIEIPDPIDHSSQEL
jgi:signal transduction histidine kinase